MKNVLVTSTGSVACDIVIKSLKRMGYFVVGCNIYPKEWVAESCEVDKFYQIPPVKDELKYLESVKRICLKNRIKYILPMIDYEVDFYNSYRKWFDDQNIVLCISPKHALEIIRDKKKLEDFVSVKCPELNPIPTYRMSNFNVEDACFPLVCKPFNGRSSQGLKYIYSKEEYYNFIVTINISDYIVEPFIKGPIIMVETIRQDKPEKVITLTRREIMSTPNGCSTTVFVYQNKSLENSTKKLANLLGVKGDVNFEYILSADGKHHLVECNPRFSAGCKFSCMGGYDCVENHMKCFTGEEIENYHFKHTMVIARKYEEYITAVGIKEPYSDTVH